MLSSDVQAGAWVSFAVDVGAAETVLIAVDRTSGANAVLSGLFLDS